MGRDQRGSRGQFGACCGNPGRDGAGLNKNGNSHWRGQEKGWVCF